MGVVSTQLLIALRVTLHLTLQWKVSWCWRLCEQPRFAECSFFCPSSTDKMNMHKPAVPEYTFQYITIKSLESLSAILGLFWHCGHGSQLLVFFNLRLLESRDCTRVFVALRENPRHSLFSQLYRKNGKYYLKLPEGSETGRKIKETPKLFCLRSPLPTHPHGFWGKQA